MDDEATRTISAALTMYDIMEQRVTLVEHLKRNRQPFREMEVVYIVAPTLDSARAICNDFENDKKAKYKAVHLYFLDKVISVDRRAMFLSSQVNNDVITIIQANGTLCQRIKTFKEIYMDFVAVESNIYHLDMPDTLTKLFQAIPDPSYLHFMARKLATLCVTLNEIPTIRYQASSGIAREIATLLFQTLSEFKRANPGYWCYGDTGHTERERGQLLIVDRSFDPLSPLMHEYTYQAMVNDLLPVEEGIISYTTDTNAGNKIEKKVILNESDELWVELRHLHIARVIEVIKERMSDIIQNNAGAALAKKSGSDMTITKMAAAVKELPEYRETMSKLSQHVHIAQQCMDSFGRSGLMDISLLEQTMSTGVDEDGKEVKGSKLMQLLGNTIRSRDVDKSMKIRLLAIFIISQRGVSNDDRRVMIEAAELNGEEQQILLNFEKLGVALQEAQGPKTGSFLSVFRGRAAAKHAPTAEGNYADTRHVCRLRGLLEQMISNELPADKFTYIGPASGSGGESKSAAKSVRRYGSNIKWGRKDQAMYTSGRYMAFIAGGVAYSEMRTCYELMNQHTKEVILGSSHLINPNEFVRNVSTLQKSSA